MHKSLPIAILASTIVLAACSGTTPQTSDQSSSVSSAAQSSVMMAESSSSVRTIDVDLTPTGTSSMTTGSAMSAPSAARIIEVDVASFQFTPNVITAKKGEKVTLKLVGMNGIHGFAVPELDISVRVEAGNTVMVDLPTDTASTFQAFCNVPCGEGHKNMKATIVIS